jgi:hypothetical protein
MLRTQTTLDFSTVSSSGTLGYAKRTVFVL